MVPRLVERERAVAAIDQAIARGRDGHGGVLVVVGDAGVGKTALLDAAVRAATPSMDVVVGRSGSLESAIPWGLLEQLLRSLAGDRAAAELVAPLEPSAPYLRAVELIRGVARPLLLAIDDLHWADPDSLDVVGFVARRIADVPATLIATLRSWPRDAHDTARALVDGGHAELLHLDPLSYAGSRAMLDARAGTPVDQDEHDRSWELCRGNPLLIEQLASTRDRSSGPGPAATPATLLVERFAGLDGPSLEFARCASVMGTRFWPDVAGRLADLDRVAFDRAVDALHRAGLAVADGHRMRFAHPLFAQTLYDDLAPPLRRRLHARAFTALERAGRLDEAAEHATRGATPGDAPAAALLERVGTAALRSGAIAVAADRLSAATRLHGDHAPPRLVLALAEAQCAHGDVRGATVSSERVVGSPAASWRERLDGLVLLGRCRYLSGDPDRGETALQHAVDLAERHDPARAVAPLLDQAASAWLVAGPGHALVLATQARALASDANPQIREAAEAAWGHLVAETGDPRGIAATEPVGRVLRSVRDDAGPLRPAELVTPRASIYPFAHCALYAERFDDVERALGLAIERLERAGAANALAVACLFSANHLIRRGRLREALAALDRAERFGELTPVAMPATAMLRAQALLWLGDVEQSATHAARGRELGRGQWAIALWSAYLDGLGGLWNRDPRASDAFLEVERIAAAAGIGEPSHTQWGAQGVAAHLIADRADDARRVAASLEDAAADHPARWPRFAAQLAGARLAEHSGDLAVAVDRCRAALDALGDVDLPLQRVEAQVALGRLLRLHGHPRAARPVLSDAAHAADACGAEPLRDAAAAELRLAGGRRRRPRARDRLTPGELRVASAAAGGATNAEIAHRLHLSIHTVETHLKRTYAKLGVPGRRHLRRSELARHADRADDELLA